MYCMTFFKYQLNIFRFFTQYTTLKFSVLSYRQTLNIYIQQIKNWFAVLDWYVLHNLGMVWQHITTIRTCTTVPFLFLVWNVIIIVKYIHCACTVLDLHLLNKLMGLKSQIMGYFLRCTFLWLIFNFNHISSHVSLLTRAL